MPAGGVMVQVAFNDPVLEPDPEWTDLTDSPNLVASVTVDRGRLYELDRTDTGTASVAINDTEGVFDPNNLDGPYLGKIEPLLQAQIQLRNPVTGGYTVLFRGFIEDWNYDFDPSQAINRLTLSLVDAFAILEAVEMVVTPEVAFGDVPPDGASVGNLFYDTEDVDDRIKHLLTNAGWPSDLWRVFSGNVTVRETVYAPGDSVLQAIQDAADAEFPGVANVYVSKEGFVTFHGRLAKFDPVGVSTEHGTDWDFTIWKAGDGAAVAASISDTAQVRGLSMNRGLAKVINSGLAYPFQITDTDMIDQSVQDLTSIAKYGYRSWTASDLLTRGSKTGDNVGLPNAETKLFATYYVANYATPQNRVNGLTFRSMHPSDDRAGANWALLCGAEISDQVNLIVTAPGGGGFNGEGFFIEGVHYAIDPLDPGFANVTLTLDLSPVQYFSDGEMFGVGV